MSNPRVILQDILAKTEPQNGSEEPTDVKMEATGATDENGPAPEGTDTKSEQRFDQECDAIINEFEEILEADADTEGFFVLDSVDNNEEGEIADDSLDEKPPKSQLDTSHQSDVEILNNDEIIELDDEPKDDEEQKPIVHPYLYLLENFKPTKEQLSLSPVIPVKSLSETKLVEVSTTAHLLKMLQELRTLKEISLNIHFDGRNYDNIVSIMEISTGSTDYLIDAVLLRNDILLLTEVFVNPNILKIIHDADTTLSYLQHSLHMFVINMFDVYEAFKKNGEDAEAFRNKIINDFNYKGHMPGHIGNMRSTSTRLTQVPPDRKDVFRVISHYLPYLYREYKNELIEKDVNLLKELIDICNEKCKKVYDAPRSSSYNILVSQIKIRHQCELYVVDKAYTWCENYARQHEGESNKQMVSRAGLKKLAYVLPGDIHQLHTFLPNTLPAETYVEMLKIALEARVKYNFYDAAPKNRIDLQLKLIEDNQRKPRDLLRKLESAVQPRTAKTAQKKKRASRFEPFNPSGPNSYKAQNAVKPEQRPQHNLGAQNKPRPHPSPKPPMQKLVWTKPSQAKQNEGAAYFNKKNQANDRSSGSTGPPAKPTMAAIAAQRQQNRGRNVFNSNNKPGQQRSNNAGSFRSSDKPDRNKFAPSSSRSTNRGFDEPPTFHSNLQANNLNEDFLKTALSMLQQNIVQQQQNQQQQPVRPEPDYKRMRLDREDSFRDERRNSERDRSSGSSYDRDRRSWRY